MKRRFFVSEAVRQIAKTALKQGTQVNPSPGGEAQDDIDAVAQALAVFIENRRKAIAISSELFREPTRNPWS